MKKQIAITSAVKIIFKESLGSCVHYVNPVGNSFVETLDSSVEVVIFKSGSMSICGFGERNLRFDEYHELRDFIRNKTVDR